MTAPSAGMFQETFIPCRPLGLIPGKHRLKKI
jgi:hypothetical protein